jgi:tRNA threonylcarbamoyladenosine biosynthesis protein TsaE
LRWRSRSADDSRRAAAALGAALDAALAEGGGPLVVALVGTLGAGKTEWVKGLAEGLGVDPKLVASPTFVIASEYPGRRRLAHVDLYRIESEAELEATGFLDLLAPGMVVAVEWADRFPGSLPADRIEVRIARPAAGAPDEREIELRATGPQAWRAIGRWAMERGRPQAGAERPPGP